MIDSNNSKMALPHFCITIRPRTSVRMIASSSRGPTDAGALGAKKRSILERRTEMKKLLILTVLAVSTMSILSCSTSRGTPPSPSPFNLFDTQQARPAARGVDQEKEINRLIETLSTHSSSYREDVKSLIGIGKPAVPALLKALHDPRDASSAETIVQALIGIRDPSSIDELYAIAKGNGYDLSAIRILGYFNEPKIVGYLIDLMKSKNDQSLVAARHGLIRQGSVSVSSLLEIVKGSYENYRRENAIIALGEIQDKAALPALEQAAKEPYEPLKNCAVEAIKKIQADEKARQTRRKVWLLVDSQIDQKYYDFSNPITRDIAAMGSSVTPVLIEMQTNPRTYELVGSWPWSAAEPLIYRTLSVIGDREASQFLVDRVIYVVNNRYYANQPGMVDMGREIALHDALVRLGRPIIPSLNTVYREHSGTKPVGSSQIPTKDAQIRDFISGVIGEIDAKK